MSSIKLLEQNKISVIEEREESFEDQKITYRLYRIDFIETTKYAVCVNLKNESEVCFLDSNLSEAKILYDKICRNAVTPCTLAYVIEDYFKEKY